MNDPTRLIIEVFMLNGLYHVELYSYDSSLHWRRRLLKEQHVTLGGLAAARSIAWLWAAEHMHCGYKETPPLRRLPGFLDALREKPAE